MQKGEANQQFTKGFAEIVRCAIDLNEGKTNNIYYHPSEKKIVVKCIDLSCHKPLTAVHTAENKPKSCSAERWLEAYLIRKAKRNNWELELAGKRFKFLYSQLKFRRTGIKKARPLDLLLYEQETGQLVVMELKAKRVLEAVDELKEYIIRLKEIKVEIARVFELGKVSGVQGYIVWPRNERANNDKLDFGPFGVIEYTRIAEPWEEFKKLGEDLTIEFKCVREPQAK